MKEWLDRGIVDIGLLREPVNVEKYSYIRMKMKDEWGILLSEKHPLAAQEKIQAKDLAGVPMVTIRDDVIHSELTNWSGKSADRIKDSSPFLRQLRLLYIKRYVYFYGGV